MKDRGMCELIASELRPGDFDLALEIGPGRGALTEFLYPLWGDKLSLVEIDPALAARIKEKYPSVRVHNADFLGFDLDLIGTGTGKGIGEKSEGRRQMSDCFLTSDLRPLTSKLPLPLPPPLPFPSPAVTVAFIGNLPYECATAILLKTLAFSGFGAAVFMFQREVAAKITASAGDFNYGYLSVAAQVQSGVKLLSEVPAGSFSPAPEVNSSVLVFTPLRAFSAPARRDAFLDFVKHAFSHRRKTLMNSLALGLCRDKDSVKNVIETAGFDSGTRPQNLSVRDYLKLAEAFEK